RETRPGLVLADRARHAVDLDSVPVFGLGDQLSAAALRFLTELRRDLFEARRGAVPHPPPDLLLGATVTLTGVRVTMLAPDDVSLYARLSQFLVRVHQGGLPVGEHGERVVAAGLRRGDS